MKLKNNSIIKKLQIVIFIIVIGCSSVACSEQNVDQLKENVTKKKEEVSEHIQKEIKAAILTQIQDFFKDTDFMEAFGISDVDKEKLEQQMKELVENYEFDVSNLKDVQEQLDMLLDPEVIKQQENQDYEQIKQVLEELKKKITEGLGYE